MGINQIKRKYSRIYREHLLLIELDAATRLYYIWTHLIQDSATISLSGKMHI